MRTMKEFYRWWGGSACSALRPSPLSVKKENLGARGHLAVSFPGPHQKREKQILTKQQWQPLRTPSFYQPPREHSILVAVTLGLAATSPFPSLIISSSFQSTNHTKRPLTEIPGALPAHPELLRPRALTQQPKSQFYLIHFPATIIKAESIFHMPPAQCSAARRVTTSRMCDHTMAFKL